MTDRIDLYGIDLYGIDLNRNDLNGNHSITAKLVSEAGFTLIEMMISMAMGLILIAGIASVFASMGKTSSVVSSQTERMSDLYLMSQIMQEELRLSRKTQDVNQKVLANLTTRGVNIATRIPGYPATDALFDVLPYWDQTTHTLTYQNIDGDVGIFSYQYGGNNDSVYWLRADATTFDELSRNMDLTTGMCALDVNNVCATAAVAGVSSIKLLAAYKNESHLAKTMSLSFMIWPRN